MKAKLILWYLLLMAAADVCCAQEYRMSGPYEVVARDGEFRGSKGGSERDMKAAWNLAQEGKYDEALRIINAYAETLQRLDGHDAPLCLIQGYWLCRAMMLLKEQRTPAWEAMLRRAMIPTMNKFEADSPYANGNWGAIVNRFRMACAIAIDDRKMYQAAIDYYLHAYDNGALPNYVSETGQCQETGRDQSHAQLGLGALCEICEMAWEQGDDLWGALDNRLMKGIEYTAKYNLGYDVPFETWTDCTGLYNDWTEPGAMGRGRLWQIYQMPYNHYVGRKGLKMPYTKKVLDIYRKAAKEGKVKPGLESETFYAPGMTGSLPNGEGLHRVVTYPAPQGAPLNDNYDVYIQSRGAKEWQHIDTYVIKDHPFAYFAFTGDVFVRVISKNKKFQTARVNPKSAGVIANVQNDSTVQFLLFQPESVSVELDGDLTHSLLLFTAKPSQTEDFTKITGTYDELEWIPWRPFNLNLQLAYCYQQVKRALEALRPYDFTMMPRNILTGEQIWNCRKAKAEEWCSGFWPGILWMVYDYTRSEAVMKAAMGYTDAIAPIVAQPVYDHDLGFIVINSFLKGYEQTKDARYKQLALQAADSLATLYNNKVGTILSWPRHVKDYGGHNTIMDNMMNLELLFWASLTPDPSPMREGNLKGEGRKHLYDIAVRHAETTMKNQFREDGSCYHVAVYDTIDGHFIKGVTHQGYSNSSMWSRGQSWAIYGYTMVYRYTRDQRFLDHAQRVTDIYLKRLKETSDDMVPIWDMDDPEAQIVNSKSSNSKYKDASAACIVASALLELCQYVKDGDRYREAAIQMLRDLSTDRYQSRDKNVSFLMHNTGHHPAGSEIDASIVYADYYYLEALLRLKQFQ